MSNDFIHLRLHTEYSIVDGVVRIDELVDRVAAAGMPACAVTDQGNLFGLIKFYRAAESRGIKPLLGADLWVDAGKSADRRHRITCLCQDLEGYRNLAAVITRSYTEGQRGGVPEVRAEWFEGCSGGLILLSGGREGDVGQALLGGNLEEARRLAIQWQALFPGRYFLELVRTRREHEETYIEAAVDLAAALDLPVVATNDVRFLDAEDYEAHEARVCIHEGRTLNDPRRPRPYSNQQYLKSPEEMAELFADLPEAVANTRAIAERCSLELTLGQYFLPAFPVPPGHDADDWLREQSAAGLEARLGQLLDPASADFARRRKPYDDRLTLELDVICKMGFPGYFLIVADFIRWAKENGIPVGPGRGSGAGSLVAYALGITELDPLAYDLLFERFLNPERISMPDFDVDFCMDRRDEVIDYVARRYGRDRVSQIITHGTMAAKAVVRDVGRVLGFPYGFCDQIAKLIPFELDMTLEKALNDEGLRSRYEQEEDVRSLIDLARKLEGLVRNAGRHAGGVVISPTPLTDFTPLYCEQGATSTVTQFDMGDVEAMGLVKFDFLGLRTLTIIDWAVRDINRERTAAGLPPVDVGRLPLDDAATYELIRRAETTAVFQLESRGMRELIKRLKPDSFEDLIALVALFRPGPLQSGMVDDFIDRKHGKAKVAYPHPALEPILKPTYGVIVYQEQVMQIAQVLAGYTLGAADMLRRAMGKKKPEEMAKQRAIFAEGAKANGVDPNLAESIFDLMEKFAGYGFNKSHSAAYALVAYQTAWLKAHHPAAFMAAVLSADMDHTDKVVGLINECRRMNLEVLPPDVTACEFKFTVADARTVRYGLGAVKGVGLSAIEGLVAERAAAAYEDLFDLCRRLDTRKLNRRALEALLKAGALDALGPGRASMMLSLDAALAAAEQHVKNETTGQNDLFGLSADEGAGSADTPAGPTFVAAPDWPDDLRLAGEKETLGLYLTGHPYDRYERELAGLVSARLGDVKPGNKRRVAGLVSALRMNNSRRGRMAVVTLDDGTARLDVTVYSDLYNRSAELLAKDRVLVVEGNCQLDEFSGGYAVTADRILTVEDARVAFGKQLVLRIGAEQAVNGFVDHLRDLLDPYRRGEVPVVIDYARPEAQARLRLGEEWRVKPCDALLDGLRAAFGPAAVDFEYTAQTLTA